MKPICLDLGECDGIGDLICATPTIKKLHDSYGQKVTILSKFPEIFKLNPFVEKSYKIFSIDLMHFSEHYLMHNSFYNVGVKNDSGVEYKYNTIDIRQYHAINLGFTLYKNEMECYYAPIDTCKFKMDSPYICIDISGLGVKDWGAHNWSIIINKINSLGIKVVLLGKKSEKENIEFENAIDLINQTSISDCWHLISGSLCFVTIDGGLLHLAGTTDTHIIQLGSNINPELRTPYRQGTQSYKHTYVKGECAILCASDMKYSVREWGNIQSVPPTMQCLENKSTFECHPTIDKVFDVIKNII